LVIEEADEAHMWLGMLFVSNLDQAVRWSACTERPMN
jgi:hypothetical protein